QLSLAIGKGGQNARLAAKLTGWKIDLISKSERERQKEYERRSRVDIEEFEAAGPKLREKLLREGIETVQDLLKTPLEELLAIQGVGEKTAEKLLEEARELLARRGEELEAEAARAADEAEKQKASEAAAIARLQEMEAADRVEEAEAETVREASMETEVDEQMRGDDSIGENEAVQVGDVETMTIDEGEEDHLRPVEDEAAAAEAADATDQDEDETREERATGAESEGPPPRA
ncbi:MAG TPA: helix-hairpin-helix domain-containing protein, partial [Candidatus Eisenbacteria bacterium]|nr:helix-hairpin-helix domain-containing protein [Candidatus Eisenbacteria bacterium]